MSRSSYSDDFGDEYPGQLELYRANVKRSMQGRAGQARLRELRDALLALPVKELHAGRFAEGTTAAPKVCALGAWAWRKANGDVEAAARIGGGVDAEDVETAASLKPMGWPELVVLDTIFQNDDDRYVYETYEGPRRQWESYYGPLQYGRPETPAERYTRVLKWVEAHIINEVTR